LKEIVDYVCVARKEFGLQSRIATVLRVHAPRDTGLPKFGTLLKRCATLGVSPVDLLQDPVGTSRSINLLGFAELDVPADRKPRRPEHLLELAEQRLVAELEKTDFDSQASLAQIAKDLGVSKGFLNYRLGALVAKYGIHRRHCGQQKYVDQIMRATAFLLSGPVKSYPCPKYPSHDHLVTAAVVETKVGVRVARLAVDAALKKTLGISAYTRYRKANGLYTAKRPANGPATDDSSAVASSQG